MSSPKRSKSPSTYNSKRYIISSPCTQGPKCEPCPSDALSKCLEYYHKSKSEKNILDRIENRLLIMEKCRYDCFDHGHVNAISLYLLSAEKGLLPSEIERYNSLVDRYNVILNRYEQNPAHLIWLHKNKFKVLESLSNGDRQYIIKQTLRNLGRFDESISNPDYYNAFNSSVSQIIKYLYKHIDDPTTDDYAYTLHLLFLAYPVAYEHLSRKSKEMFVDVLDHLA